jgi:ABC-type uncharacterized transport system involved in gliding motility auxiliary subunit/ABC-type transport system involved in cytochrome c biogenesis permease component
MNSIGNIKTVAKRELASYLTAPLAYIFVVIFLALIGFFTFSMDSAFYPRFFTNGQASLASFFQWHPWLYLFFVPCIGMRLWAEERRVGTIELLLTKPITPWQAIMGKFLASWIFLGGVLILTFPLVLTVNFLGHPDNGLIFATYLGSFLMAGTYLAISCMTSAMTRNQIISLILSSVICLFLVLCGWPTVTDYLTRFEKPWLVDLVASLSVMTHFQPFTTGLIDSRDVIFFLLIIAFVLFTTGVILRSYQAASDKLMKRRSFERLLYSGGGVVAMFIVMVAAYIITSAIHVRGDITEEKNHTLTAGTRRILNKLDARITMRYYCSQGETGMPPQFKAYSHRVEDLLHEYVDESNGKLVLEKFDPQPDSEAESAAALNGVEGRPGPNGDKIYLGLVVSLLNEKFSLPFLSPDRDRLLEYDVSRAISRVASRQRPVLGIMSGVPVFGETFNPMMHADQTRREDWTFVAELKKDFEVRSLVLTAPVIPPDIKLMIVYHPVEISDATQYALDQFVLRGGKLIAFIDPHAFFDQKHDRNKGMTISGDNAAKSTLDKLLKAWGFSMDTDHVLADRAFAGHNNQSGDTMPTLLMMTPPGINQTEAATSQIDNLFLPFVGVFDGKPADGLTMTPLVSSSANSQMVDSLLATAANDILRDFKSSNVEKPIAMRLTGKFKTAFPKMDGGLKESTTPGEVIVMADTDFLNDVIAVSVQEVMGHKIVRSKNGNLNLVQSFVEQMTGDEDLITSRNRAGMNRPFTRVKDMEAKAGVQWEEKMRVLETKKREMDKKIKELQAHSEPGQNVVLTPQQERELGDYQRQLAEVNKELKRVIKNLKKDTEKLEFQAKVLNIGAMPVVVALSGMCLAVVKTRRRAAMLKQ